MIFYVLDGFVGLYIYRIIIINMHINNLIDNQVAYAKPKIIYTNKYVLTTAVKWRVAYPLILSLL